MQAEAGTGMNSDPFHFEAWMLFQHGIAAPWAVNGAVEEVFLGLFVLFELVDNFSHPLGFATIGDEYCIRGLYYTEVFHSDCSDKAVVAVDEAVAALRCYHPALQCIVIAVLS